MGVKPHVRERLAILASWPSLLGAWQLSKLRSQPMVCTNQWSVPRHNHAMKTSQKRAHSSPGSWVQNEAKSVTLADLGKAGRRWVLIQLDTASYRGGPPAVLAGLGREAPHRPPLPIRWARLPHVRTGEVLVSSPQFDLSETTFRTCHRAILEAHLLEWYRMVSSGIVWES